MKLFLLLLLIPIFSYSQVYNYVDQKDGTPEQVPNTLGFNIIRINGCTSPSVPCSKGFSGRSFSASEIYSPSLPAFEFSVVPNQGYSLIITSFATKSRRSDQGSIFMRYAYSLDGGLTWRDNGENLSPKNSSCSDGKKREWDIVPDIESSGAVKFRIVGINAKSGNGVLQVMNVVIGGSVKQDVIITDNDKDGYHIETDCNDNDSTIHPNAIEACDNIDQNCDTLIDNGLPIFKYYADENLDGYGEDSTNFILTCHNLPPAGYVIELAPRIDLVLINTNVTVPIGLWSGTAADLFYTGNAPTCKVVTRLITSEPIYGLTEGINLNAVSISEGVTTWADAVRVGDTSVLRVEEKNSTDTCSGYNCCSSGKIPIGGACICSYKIEGKYYDAFNDYVSYIHKSKRKSIVTLNVAKGKTDYMTSQADWKIKTSGAIAAIFGQEMNSTGAGLNTDAKKYNDTCNNIMDATVQYDYKKIGDASDIASNAKKNINWNKYLAENGKFDMYDMYLQLDESTEFNGNISHDTTDLNTVPALHNKWFDAMDSMFHKPIAVTQINTSEVFSDSGAVVYPGEFMGGAFLVMTYKNMMDYNAATNNRIQIGIWQTIKNVTGKDVYDINGKFLVLLSNLFKEGSTYLKVTEESGAQIFGVKKVDEYKLIFLNKTGKDLAMPKSVALDGYIINNIKWSGSWLYSDKFTSKEALQYDNVGFLKGLSLGYATMKIPAQQ